MTANGVETATTYRNKDGETFDPRNVIVELCQNFYKLGWVSGTGGGISIKKDGVVYLAPSGVQKERLSEEDMFTLDGDGKVLTSPKNPKLRTSACAPLFYAAFNLRNAGACMHTHSQAAVLATLIFPGNEFTTTHLEMQKGIKGRGFHDKMVVPIIENTGHEADLADSMSAAIKAYPESHAVLVRRHGLYVWGKDWVEAKTMAECYDYLFEMAVRMHTLGMNAAVPPQMCIEGCELTTGKPSLEERPRKRARTGAEKSLLGSEYVVVVDIEGTTTPIDFVTKKLFPHARSCLKSFLDAKKDLPKVAAALRDLEPLAEQRGQKLDVTNVPAVVKFLETLMDENAKVTPLKTIQGLIWEKAYKDGVIKGEVYDDVPPVLQNLAGASIPVYIYSSGSVAAQKLLFSYSTHGNLTTYLTGNFDTRVGLKVKSDSYEVIADAIGRNPASILFVTDNVQEAEAATAAGWNVLVADRPGNAALPKDLAHQVINTFGAVEEWLLSH